MSRFPHFAVLAALLLTACASSPPAEEIRTYPVEISNLGAAVNSALDEFAPTITANGTRLMFTRGNGSAPFNRDFWQSTLDGEFWTTASRLPDRINRETNEGSPSLSADGQILYFAATDRPDSKGKSDLYMAQLEGREWGEARNLEFPVSTDYWESQPSATADGRTVYFVSDREGGLGGLDIWVTSLDQDDKWKVPVNVGAPINTSKDEVSPFIAKDGSTLYFASDGHAGLGGTDMFVSRLLRGSWSAPTNVGRPLNSDGNDEFFSLSAEGMVVFFSSRRPGGFGGYDLYRAEPNPFPPGAVIVLSGTVRDARSRAPLEAALRVTDATTGKEFSIQQSNAYTGEYVLVLPAGAVYEVTATAAAPYFPETARFDFLNQSVYGEVTHDFLLRKDEPLPQLEASVTADVLDFSLLHGAATSGGLTIEEQVRKETLPLLNYVFFAENSAVIPQRYASITVDEASKFSVSALPDGTLERYHHLLNIYGFRMNSEPSFRITLTGTTDGSEAPSIAKQRAEAVADYLRSVWKISPDRITVLSRGLPERPSGMRTAEGREENRRVEITSSNPALLAPLQIEDVQQLLKPPFVRFYPSITASEGLDRWRFEIRHGSTILRENEGSTTYPDSISWNWRGLDGALPAAETPMRFTLYARDKNGSEVTTQPQEIPVSLITLERKQLEQLPDRTIEKISLILFDFDRSDLSEQNQQLLDHAATRLTERSTVLIRGYTDRLGEDAYNLALSQKRSVGVREAMLRRLPGQPLRSEGVGESSLLFDNDLPEGRFYCRTVQILVETIK